MLSGNTLFNIILCCCWTSCDEMSLFHHHINACCICVCSFPFSGCISSVTCSLSLVLRIPKVNISYTITKLEINICTFNVSGMGWRSWLRHCATSWKVAGLIPDGVVGIFHWHNPSSHTMALGLTQPLTEMSTRNISWGKGGRCVGLTDYLATFLCRLSKYLGASASRNPQGLSRPVRDGFTFFYLYLPASFHRYCTLIFILILLSSEGQASETWEPTNKATRFGLSESTGHKTQKHSKVMFQALNVNFEGVRKWNSSRPGVCCEQ